jgi:Zn-finger protein
MKNCGGGYTMIDNVKDCSNCALPHKPENYDYIMSKLVEFNSIKI